MKTKITRTTIRVTLLAAALLATGFFGSVAKAQAGIQGKFTLTQETRWGQAVLRPGDYIIAFDHHMPGLLVVRDAKSRRTVAFECPEIRETGNAGKSELLMSARGRQPVVHTLRLVEIGEVYVFDPALAHGRVTEEARQADRVPVLVAKK
jgi:hypothetical protein